MPLTDCTDNRARRLSQLGLLTALVSVLASGCLAGNARADGDPASDVLAAQSLFLPQDAGLPASEQSQLTALLAGGERDGYRIRVALIASPTDLGSITGLWRRPQLYAHFLGQELTMVYRGTLLVVMPDGYGVYGVGGAQGSLAPLRGMAAPGSELGSAAVAAIRRLAAASGHPLPLATRAGSPGSGSGDAVAWLVFAGGWVLIALAWMASLRARPLGSGGSQAAAP